MSVIVVHSNYDRVLKFIQNSNLELIDSNIISRELGLTRREASAVLRQICQ